MDQVANAIAVLGIYFAMMAVLAVGVEAVISWFKVPIPWLQGKPSPNDVLKEVKDWLPKSEADSLKARITALNKSLRAIGDIELRDDTSVEDVVAKVGEATTKHVQKERVRRAIIRVMAIAFGVLFAWLFNVDTLSLLSPLFEAVEGTLQETLLNAQGAHLIGLLLSGLAASAGSSFWHDQSARLRQIKTASESAGELVGDRG